MEPEFLTAEIKQEPPEDFLLILPPATEDEPEPEQVEVKREPPEEFLLILPLATDGEPESEQEVEPEPEPSEVAKTNRQRSKKLAGSSSVFKCDQCSYQTDKKGNLTRHKRIHNKSKSCEICQKKYARNQSLKRHQMQHKHGIDATAAEETFDCDRCDKSFNTRHYLGNHQRNVHDENEVKCEVCGKICKNRKSLLNHSQTHIKVECKICHKMIIKTSMSAHNLTHSTEKPFECDLCEHSTKTKGDLQRHIERLQLLTRLVNDSKCQIDFSDFELLEELQRKHGIVTTTSERKFTCDKCDKAFATLQSLNLHKTRVHAKVSWLVCSEKFSHRYMKTHMKVHHAGDRFECDFCGVKSVNKQSFTKHIKARHRRHRNQP